MNIFWREIQATWKSLAIWCAAQAFTIMAGMLKYKGFLDSNLDINNLFADFPVALKAVFGLGEVDLLKIDGYFSIFFIFFVLLASIHAMMLGAVLIAKEERDHSADFLFAKPVNRSRVITAKLLAGLVNITVFNLLTSGASLYYVDLYNQGESLTGMVIELMVALYLLQIVFLSLGAAFGALFRTARLATSAATTLILATFFMSVGVDMDARIAFLKYVTPFSFFDAKELIFDQPLPIASIVLCILLTGTGVFLTYNQFGRRDLAV